MNQEEFYTAQPVKKRLIRRASSWVVAGLLLVGVAGGGVVGSAIGSTATLYWVSQQPQANQPQVAAAPLALRNTATDTTETNITAIYKAMGPAVVTIAASNGSGSFSGGQEAGGTGFIVSDQGYVLTNNHVVQGAQRITVVLNDGTKIEGKVAGTDPGSDLALIKADIPKGKGVVATLGDSDKVEPGEVAIAIGSPFGLDHSLTAGIVSAVNREFGTAGGRPMRGLIQTDAPINPGNSGGPLFNAQGEVIGITTSIESPVRGSVGIGFAIPINRAKGLMPKLEKGQNVDHPWLGISGVAITSDIAKNSKLPVDSGVLVGTITPESPAAKAGLKGGSPNDSGAPVGGDIITEVDGKAVKTVPDLSGYFDTKNVGDKVTLTVIRDGKPMKVTVTLGAWPSSEQG